MTALHAPEPRRAAPFDDPERDRPPAATAAARRPVEQRRRSELDRLVIGAPLTAAAVGLLLTEGARSGDGGEAGTGADPATMPVSLAGAAGRPGGSPVTASGSRSVAEGGGVESAAVASAGLPAVSLGADAVAAAEGSSGSIGPVRTTLPGPGDPAASAGAKAAVHSGPQVSISFGAAPEGAGLVEGELGPGAGAEERGDIGHHVEAGDGDDVLHGTDADDVLLGGAGDDEIHGHAGNDLIDGGTGDDLLFGGAGDDHVIGGRGHDEVHGGPGDDHLEGNRGDDLLFGEGGRDLLEGGSGADLLDGGAGADTMIGGRGDDQMVLSDLHDVALEDQRSPDRGGVDTIRVEGGAGEALAAEFGIDEATFVIDPDVDRALPDDTAAFQQQLDPDVENVHLEGLGNHDVVGNAADNHIVGNSGDNVLHGRGGNDLLVGGGGQDTLIGGTGDDLLRGGADDDILRGGDGADELHGGAGDDLLDGGAGSDRLFGEGGNDTFILGLHEDTVDIIFDDQGSNRVVIENGAGHEIETALVDGDLYIIVDKNPIAVIDDFDDASFGSIDGGSGGVAIGDLMAANAGGGSVTGTAGRAGSSSSDLLAEHLAAPSHVGGAAADLLEGTSAPDWLSGADGDDVLIGAAGSDVLQGGNGDDLLSGGAGDDIYLFTSGETGLDTIRDTAGGNVAELQGFVGARIEGIRVGDDLWIIADNAPIFRVEQIDESSFTGVRNGDEFVSVDDLLA